MKKQLHQLFLFSFLFLLIPPLSGQIFVVTNTLDSGTGSLRQAILNANANPGPDNINFSIGPPAVPPYTIFLVSALPPLNDPMGGVTIDGYTQPGAVQNTQPQGMPSNAVLQVAVNGQGNDGFTITSGNNVIKGLVIQNCFRAVVIDGTSGMVNFNTITGCYIGTDFSGTLTNPNNTGIEINQGAGDFLTGNSIGDGTPGGRNLISGNLTAGISITDAGTDGNVVAGNYIGTNISGNIMLPNNGPGVIVQNGASFNILGNLVTLAVTAERNIISGNGSYGIEITGLGTNSNAVIGNFIGTDPTGVMPVANSRTGVRIAGHAASNTIGSYNNTAYGNLISGNGPSTPGWDGVAILDTGTVNNVVEANYIGTDITGLLPLGNAYNGVSIFGGAHNNSIGALHRNIISGNGTEGVWIDGTGNTRNNNISNNYIGLDVSGATAVPNGRHGIRIDGGANGNQVGSTSTNPNYISGNINDGILISGTGTVNNIIQYCRIGVDIANNPLGNGGNGITIMNNARMTQIGGTGPFQQNTISHNSGHGILIDNAQNNTVIGTGTVGITGPNTISNNGMDGIAVINAGAQGNTFTQNSIFSNTGLGIDLNNDGVTANDPLDPDVGPNTLLNFPVITSATYIAPSPIYASNVISGTVDIVNPQLATIEIYNVGTNPDPTGYGEGDSYLISTTPDALGNWSVTITGGPAQPVANLGDQVTALTIDGTGNTSEFGQNVGLYTDVNMDPNNLVQNEVSMAIVPSQVSPILPPQALLAAYNDSPYYGGPGLGVSYSHDAGLTWTSQQLTIPNNPFAPPNTPFDRVFDPSATADINGDLYVVHIADEMVPSPPPPVAPASGIFVHKSTDLGVTWNPPVLVDANPGTIVSPDPAYRFNDRCQITADINPASPLAGALYIVWIKDNGFNTGPFSDIYFSASMDGGLTWTPAMTLNTLGNMGNAPTIAVASDGTIYVAWIDINVTTGGPGTIYLNSSIDGGATWLPVEHTVVSGNFPWSVTDALGNITPAAGAAVVEVAPNLPQQVYMVYAAVPGLPDQADIYFIRSTAGGATGSWSPPVRINDDATTTDQILPWIDVKPNGIIDIAWYDRRNDPVNDQNWDVYGTVSTDGGISFFANQKFNTIPASPTPIPGNPWMGEYLGLVSDMNTIYVGFTSSFTDINGDVYFNSYPNPILPMDYGDALDPPYPTFRFNDGARHHVPMGVAAPPWLGNQGDGPDIEPDGQPDPLAFGDDMFLPDDENGVNIPVLFPGLPATVNFEVFNIMPALAYVDGWIDFNQNGIWGDLPSEHIVTGQWPAGIHNSIINVPALGLPVPYQTVARFRINTFSPLQPVGFAFDGEVEDHAVIVDRIMWTGAVDSLWSNPANWNCGIVPDSTMDVTIPGGLTTNPFINGTADCHHLIIEDGAKLTLNTGGILTVHGDLIVGQGTSGVFVIIGSTCDVKGTTTSNPGALIDIKTGGQLNTKK